MQDRISAYPGRVKLTPVAGQADTYDLTRADQPTQEGTPLNKAAPLSDTTVNALKSGYSDWPDNADTVTPDDALARIMWLKGQVGGFASLDAMGKLTETQIPDDLVPLPCTAATVTDTGTYDLDLTESNYLLDLSMQGFSLQFDLNLNALPSTMHPSGMLVLDGDVTQPTYIYNNTGKTITASGVASVSGTTITLQNLSSAHSATVIRFYPAADGSFLMVAAPVLNAAGKLPANIVARKSVSTSGTSLNLETTDYAFNATSKTATITALPSSGVSNAIYFYGSAWATGEAMSAGDVIKLTNSSGKTIQLSTAQTDMTYSGNVLTITPHGYRDENCIGICLRFVRAGSYSRPFITKLYQ
jgi:hypothetical protein